MPLIHQPTRPECMRKAVFLDRDGVINLTIFRDGKPRAPDRLEDFTFFPDAKESVDRLRGAGFLLIVVTNQPDVARGWQTRDVVEAMNRKVMETLKTDEIRVCYHLDEDRCPCRKPKPGMLLAAAERWNIDLKASFMIGDRRSDVIAGKSAGCRTLLLGEFDSLETPDCDAQVETLTEATDWILAHTV